MRHIPPSTLVLSGGGIKGLAYVGAFIELENRNFLKNIKNILSVSSGALFGLLLIIGYTSKEMLDLVSELDFTLIQNIDPDGAFDFLINYGIDNGDNLEKFIKSLLRNKGYSENITFLELYNKIKVYYRCYAVQINDSIYKEFSYKETPNYTVIFGIRSSMCVPIYFFPLIDPYTNDIYIDGGIINNYPIHLLSEDEKKSTLGLYLSGSHLKKEVINTFDEYIYKIFRIMLLEKSKHIVKANKHRTIIIPVIEYSVMDFNLNKEDRLKIVSYGKKATEDFLNNFHFIKPTRRYSVG